MLKQLTILQNNLLFGKNFLRDNS